MILYNYECIECGEGRDIFVDNIESRDGPVRNLLCQVCQGTLKRSLSINSFTIPEGACGNAANGYSSYHGDSEIFKRRNRRK